MSKQTVSNVLNAPDLVAPGTAARVREVVRSVGYRPHPAARQLRTRRSGIIAVRAENTIGNKVFDRYLHAVTGAAAARDYRLMLYSADDEATELVAFDELVDRWDVDGVLMTGTHPGDPRPEHLLRIGLPCVTFGRPWGGDLGLPWVDVDGAAGTRAATEHLIAAGHSRVAYIGEASPGISAERLRGWRDTVQKHRLPEIPPELGPMDVPHGRTAAARLMDLYRPTALVCSSDIFGLAALRELGSRGLQAGASMAVVGFDDSDVAEVVGLSSLAQPLTDVAAHCVRLLVDLIERPVPSPEPSHVLLQPELVIRASSRPA